MNRNALLLAAATSLTPFPALAVHSAPTGMEQLAADAPDQHDTGAHHDEADEIIGTGVRRGAADVLGGVSILDSASGAEPAGDGSAG